MSVARFFFPFRILAAVVFLRLFPLVAFQLRFILGIVFRPYSSNSLRVVGHELSRYSCYHAHLPIIISLKELIRQSTSASCSLSS